MDDSDYPQCISVGGLFTRKYGYSVRFRRRKPHTQNSCLFLFDYGDFCPVGITGRTFQSY
ncbi:hypothetical protein DN42_3019 [Vibrio cholerae]|nr:hypothetical protein DN42_3019 [Vibrio cholerae]